MGLGEGEGALVPRGGVLAVFAGGVFVGDSLYVHFQGRNCVVPTHLHELVVAVYYLGFRLCQRFDDLVK